MVCAADQDRQRVIDPRVSEVIFPFPPISPFTRHLLPSWLRGRRFDLFHSTCDISPRGLRQPLVSTIHDINWIINKRYNSFSWLYQQVVGTFYKVNLDATMRDAARILTVSNASRRGIVEYAPWYENKVRVTHNGIDREHLFPMARGDAFAAISDIMPPDTPFVFTVGHGSPHKNHYHAVLAFLEAFADRPDYRMVLLRRLPYGDHKLKALLQTPAARGRVMLQPHVSQEQLNALYNAARIFLHPSYFEGFGIPLLEAMATDTPVVTSSISAMPEVAGDAAVLASPADPHALAAALVQVDQDEPLRRKLVAAGHKRLEKFTWNSTARATLQAYREVA